jgi:hypothetical protein
VRDVALGEGADGDGRHDHTRPMADKPGHYWDLERAEWVRYELAAGVEVPAQPTGVEDEQEADVRSH